MKRVKISQVLFCFRQVAITPLEFLSIYCNYGTKSLFEGSERYEGFIILGVHIHFFLQNNPVHQIKMFSIEHILALLK